MARQNNPQKRRFRSQKIDAEIEVSAEAEVPLPFLRHLQNLSHCEEGQEMYPHLKVCSDLTLFSILDRILVSLVSCCINNFNS